MKIVRSLLTILFQRKAHTASVIFFHGAGDTGPNLREWVQEMLGRYMEFPHINVIYPTAPVQSYTPADGDNWNIWFDWQSLNISTNEDPQSMTEAYDIVHDLLQTEKSQGISSDRIIVGGFSMGGTLALHAAYHLDTNLAGVFACSSLLLHDSVVYKSLKSKGSQNLPELLMFHGDQDDRISTSWAKETYNQLTNHGVSGSFTLLGDAGHELTSEEIQEINGWIETKLP